MDNDVKVLFPEILYTMEDGSHVIVKPVPFGKLHLFSEIIVRLMDKFAKQGFSPQSMDDWKKILTIAYDESVALMMLVLGKEKVWFDNISIGDGLGLLDVIIDQNFTEKSKNNLKKILEKTNLVSVKLPNTSLNQDTPGTA